VPAVVLLCLVGNSIILLKSPSPTSSSLLGLEDPQGGGRALIRELAGIWQQTYIRSRRTLILI
jgi:hypothetical protein